MKNGKIIRNEKHAENVMLNSIQPPCRQAGRLANFSNGLATKEGLDHG